MTPEAEPAPDLPAAPTPPALATVAPVAAPDPPSDAVSSLAATGITGPGAASSKEKSGTLFDLMNAARLAGGQEALEHDDLLDEVALVRARDLLANGYFDHYGPSGSSAFSELALRGRRYHLAGENLARNNYPEGRTVRAAFDGLMASPGHRANIMEERFSRAGVAALQSGRVWVYVTVFTD